MFNSQTLTKLPLSRWFISSCYYGLSQQSCPRSFMAISDLKKTNKKKNTLPTNLNTSQYVTLIYWITFQSKVILQQVPTCFLQNRHTYSQITPTQQPHGKLIKKWKIFKDSKRLKIAHWRKYSKTQKKSNKEGMVANDWEQTNKRGYGRRETGKHVQRGKQRTSWPSTQTCHSLFSTRGPLFSQPGNYILSNIHRHAHLNRL